MMKCSFILLIIMANWVHNAFGSESYTVMKADFEIVATRLGFDVHTIQLHENKITQITTAVKPCGSGWIKLQMNADRKFDIVGCQHDEHDIKIGYYRTGWISFDQASTYQLDLNQELARK